jgi:uncharacterized delta-60 repeat protein
MNRNHLGRLYPDGSLDATLDPGESAQQVYNVALQPDGKIIVAGYFTNIFGEPHQHIVRLNACGSVDHSFTAAADYYVLHVALQLDGRILLSGGFTNLNGQQRQGIGRLNSDGTLDGTFDPGVDRRVDALIEQPDGKILVGGCCFSTIAGETRNHIARLNADGTLDSTFIASLNINWVVDCLALQSDGKILVGGFPSETIGEERRPLLRLLADGRVDSCFNPSLGRSSTLPFWEVKCLAIQPDGKVLFGGSAFLLGNVRTNLARLNADGSLDDTFRTYAGNGIGLNPDVLSMAVQADGKIMVGGYFNTLNGETRNLIARLNSDGSLDNTYVPGHSGAPPGWSPGAQGLAIQTDGKTLVPGPFTELSGQPRFYLGRLTSGTAAMQRLSISADGSAVTWLRRGSSPEVQQVTFEQSINGTNYSALGNGTRIDGGWQLSGLTLPAGQNIYVRARARTVGGSRNGSSGIIESVAQFWRLPSPFISSVQVLDGGVFQFSFTNRNAVLFSVLASPDVAAPLSSWENLGAPVPIGNGLYQFTDPGASNHARRFYQLRTP